MEKITEAATPNASRFMEQVVRGSGYSFPSALADLVDNSIEAKATLIEIFVDLEGLRVAILDNGKGMSDAVHSEAMKIAAESRSYTSTDLGKFGTGMKAASLSQARRLVVATKRQQDDRILVRCLDMDHINETNDWEKLTLVLSDDVLPADLAEKLRLNGGTVILLEKLDRIFINNSLTASSAREELRRQAAAAEDHIAMTFHRFLEGQAESLPNLQITINGESIAPWNPFALEETNRTIVEPRVTLRVGRGEIHLTGYILPGEKEFSSPQAFKVAGGPNRWIGSQGFWVYRNDRLIRGGGWLKMRSPDTHTILGRIALDFKSDLDEVFGIDVAKSRVTLPIAVRKDLDKYVTAVISKAKKRYGNQSRLTRVTTGGLLGGNAKSSPQVQRRMSARSLAEFIEQICEAAKLDSELSKIKGALREQNASVAKEIGWE